MKSIRVVLSLVLSLMSAIVVFLLVNFACEYFDRLTHHSFAGFWRIAGFVVGLVLGLVVSGIVKNLIYEEPTRF